MLRFCAVDMKTTVILLKLVKRIFPTFEFTWLGEEMELNLPLEMDFRELVIRTSPDHILTLLCYQDTRLRLHLGALPTLQS